MAEEQDAPDMAPRNRFVYEGGKFTPGAPLGLGDDDIEAALVRAGYEPQQVGEESQAGYTLWEDTSTFGPWVVCFGMTNRCCWITCPTWPDLIELLAKLSTIALAGLIREYDQDGNNCPAHLPVGPVRAYGQRPGRPRKE
jgi:hypothetical protein